MHRKCLDDAISAVNLGRVVLRGISVRDPDQETPALVRTSVKPEVPGGVYGKPPAAWLTGVMPRAEARRSLRG